nr:hypothetical protein [Tanacetum cinerariifolium]
MENTMLELLEDCRRKELYCMHNDVDDLTESALNSKVLLINLKSQRLDKEKQEVKNIVEDKHLSTIPETESDEIKKSSVENLVPIPREYEVTSDNESKCDVPIFEDSSFDALKDHYEILSDSNDDDTLSDDDAFEDIDDHMKETRSGSITSHGNNSLSEYDSFHFEIKSNQGRLTSVVMENISDDSTNDPLLEAVDLFFALDNSIPSGIENIDYDSEGDIHFLKELLSNDSIPLLKMSHLTLIIMMICHFLVLL